MKIGKGNWRTKKRWDKTENKQEHGKNNPNHVNSYVECKWSDHSNQKEEIVRLNKKTRFNYRLFARQPLNMKKQRGYK